jgi:hypothetical protein
MSAYFLTEAYQSVYKQRLTEGFEDNLRFIDYMLDEDIQAVVESLYWEFQDYGLSSEEAFEVIRESASPQIISESYQVLSEVRNPELRAKARQMKADARVAQREKQLKDTNATSAGVENRLNQRASRVQSNANSVKRRLDGPIRGVQAAMSGAKAGFGMAKSALSSAGGAMNQARKEGQAKLGSLLRAGAQRLGLNRVKDAAKAAAHELSGRGARERQLKTDFAKNVSNVRSARREAERTKFGSEVASQLRTPSKDSSTPTSSPTKSSTSNARGFTPSNEPRSPKPPTGAAQKKSTRQQERKQNWQQRRETQAQRLAQNIQSVLNSQRPSTSTTGRLRSPAAPDERTTRTTRTRSSSVTPQSSPRRYPTEADGQTTLFTQAPKAKSAGIKTSVPVGGQRKFGRTIKPKPTERTTQTYLRFQKNSYEPLLDAILEDLIYEGYANNLDEALYIIENISEEALCEITEEYLAE